MWHKIIQDIRKAPLWVWIGLAGTLVLVWFAYQQWANGGTGGIALQPIGGGGGTGGIGPGPAPLPPLPPDVFTPTDSSGSSSSSSSSTGTSTGTSTDTGGSGSLLGDLFGGIAQVANKGMQQMAGLTPNQMAQSRAAQGGSVPIGAGNDTAINNPTAAAQREHRGLSTPNPGPQHRSPHEQPHPSLTFHRTNKTRGRVFD